jgi:hypothetical protein
MKIRQLLLLIFGFCNLLLLSCRVAEEIKLPPKNLVITTDISSDGSGKVVFTATAENVSSFEFNLGNSETLGSATGKLTYIYTEVGTKTYQVVVTAKSSSGLTLQKSVEVTVKVNAFGTTLIWSDEFDVDGAPDATKWTYDLGDGCPNNCGWGNNESEYYTKRPENVIVEGGILKIKAIKESYNTKPYTSARILTQGKFSFTYGKVEIRAKLPVGAGTWPALWMLGSDIGTAGWPNCGEIDIMEHVGKDLNRIYGTLHYPGRSGGNANGSSKIINNVTTEYHIYTLEWTASSIKIFADGELIHFVSNNIGIPFNHDFFIIMNVAMGGNFGGPVDASITNATMEVDYIRVYK